MNDLAAYLNRPAGPRLSVYLNRPRTARDLIQTYGIDWLPKVRYMVRVYGVALAWGTDRDNRCWYWRERSRDAPALDRLLDRLGIDERGAVR